MVTSRKSAGFQYRTWRYPVKWGCLGVATWTFCDEFSSITCQVYHGEGNVQEAHVCGPKIQLSFSSYWRRCFEFHCQGGKGADDGSCYVMDSYLISRFA
jgi:hypothetical protein